MRRAEARAHQEPVERCFLREAAVGVADLVGEDMSPGNLTLPLCVSTWVARSDVDLDHACALMLALRSALLAVSGLDRASEPVPLMGGDRRNAIVTLAVYLHGLVERGARLAATSRLELADAALSHLGV
jgi:hypothetical protein